MPRNRIIAIALVAITTLSSGLWLWQREPMPKADPAEVANAFLGDLRTGDKTRIDAAWERTTVEFKSFQGKDTFRKAVMSEPSYRTTAELKSTEAMSVSGRSYELLRYGCGAKTIRVELVAVQGEWKVERLATE